MDLFGTSGIRGKVPGKINPEIALKIGISVGKFADGSVVVGRDTRSSGEMLINSLKSGILSSGEDVIDLGVVPTPITGFAVTELGADLGITVTASHNPPSYNGFKFWDSDGSAFTQDQQKKIEGFVREDQSLSSWNEIGDESSLSIFKDYKASILDKIDIEDEYKVVVDPGNGSGYFSSFIQRELGNKVITLNSDPSKEFSRSLEPSGKNLTDLSEAVRRTNADVGIAHDGDADRIGVVDSEGNFMNYDLMLALIAKYNSSKEFVTTVDASMLLDKFLDVPVYRTKVGDVSVVRSIKERGSDFGGEPSGTWIFPDWQLTPDGIFAGVKVIELMDKVGKLSEIRKEVPNYSTVREKVKCSDDKKSLVQTYIEENVSDVFEFEKLRTIDGVRIESNDFWVLFRPSGTEPVIRITLEAENSEKIENITKKSLNLVKKGLKEV